MQLILRIGLSISYGIIVEALFTGILRIGLSISYHSGSIIHRHPTEDDFLSLNIINKLNKKFLLWYY